MRISITGLVALTMVSAFWASEARAQVTLELRPPTQTVVAGRELEVGVYAVADPAELIGLVAVVVGWDPARVELLGHSTVGAHPWASSSFPFGGLNPGIENPNAWDDGTAFFQATVGAECDRGEASADGLLITTFRFLALSGVGDTSVSILASFGGFNTTLLAGTGLAGCPADPVGFTIGPPVVASVIACTVPGDCDTGDACLDHACDGSTCSYQENYDLATECCNPADGATTPLSDGSDCTADVCNEDGSVIHIDLGVGASCGDPTDNTCTDPDTCDGAGTCLPNNASNGTVCNDLDVCTSASACSDGGCAVTAFEPAGTSCDDGLDCTLTDECDGAGICQGTDNPCAGNPVDHFCIEADDPGPPALPYTCVVCEVDADCPDNGCMAGDCSPLTRDCGFTIEKLCTDTFQPCGQSSECPNGDCVDGCEAVDGLFCNGVSFCENVSGTCQPEVDPNPCPAQFCSEDLGCVDCLSPADCDQTDLCSPQSCVDGFCDAATPPDCSALNAPCAIGFCDSADGQCDAAPVETVPCVLDTDCAPTGYLCVVNFCSPIEGCDDGDICTPTDVCENGLCVPLDTSVPSVDLNLVSSSSSVSVGDIVNVDLYAHSADGLVHGINTIEAVLVWPAESLWLIDRVVLCEILPFPDNCTLAHCDPGTYAWLSSGFPGGVVDPDGINLSHVDGDAYYQANRSTCIDPAPVGSGQDLWVVRFIFQAIGPTSSGTPAEITLDPCYGERPTLTRVLGDGAGLNITADLGLATVAVRCTTDAHCDDDDCCTEDSCGSGGVCENAPIAGCTPCGSDLDCDDGADCTDDACSLDGCCTNIDTCVDDGLVCTGIEACNLSTGFCETSGNPCPDADPPCNEVDGCPCSAPLVVDAGSRYLAITPQPAGSSTPVKFLVASPEQPCLSKYVGKFRRCDGVGQACHGDAICGGGSCIREAELQTIDIDVDGNPDGVLVTLVDDPADALLLTPDEWVAGIVDGRVFVTGQDIAPSSRPIPTDPIDEVYYEVRADCGGLTDPASTRARVWGDTDRNDVVSFTDIQLTVLAFQGNYGLGDNEPNNIINCDMVNTANPCEPEQINNFVDIAAVIKAFQAQTYAEYLAQFSLPAQACDMPCP